MKPIFIHSAALISAQDTFGESQILKKLNATDSKVEAIHPNYREFIPPAQARRMATGVKMGFAAAKKSLTQANLEIPDAIITGTGMGCNEDTEKFLNKLIADDEQYLTPTAFIQSTHNTVAAQIALALKCHGYNNNHVHGAASFESAVIDAQLLILTEEAQNILVGGVDELGDEFIDYVILQNELQQQKIKVPFSEGAGFFMLGSEKKNAIAQLTDVAIYSKIKPEEVEEKLNDFLTENSISTTEIDLLLTGNNGDEFDVFFDKVSEQFSSAKRLNFKEYSGEFHTASVVAFWMAVEKLKAKEANTVLIYNQFKGENHTFTLLKSC